mgnify:CR=1 FL=1
MPAPFRLGVWHGSFGNNLSYRRRFAHISRWRGRSNDLSALAKRIQDVGSVGGNGGYSDDGTRRFGSIKKPRVDGRGVVRKEYQDAEETDAAR